ncbi:MAG: ribonuclease III [Lachnospiraceae bacterium]|nr:ribonuclease III [Candidatus Equihabitans merdae]
MDRYQGWRQVEKEIILTIAPLTLAYLGDAVYELEIRERLVMSDHSRPSALNRHASRLVSAKGQSAMVAAIEPMLTEEEASVYRRGRNAKSPTSAKNQSIQDYRRATGFEALMGYLHLAGQKERMNELIEAGLAVVDPKAAGRKMCDADVKEVLPQASEE